MWSECAVHSRAPSQKKQASESIAPSPVRRRGRHPLRGLVTLSQLMEHSTPLEIKPQFGVDLASTQSFKVIADVRTHLSLLFRFRWRRSVYA